jgi:hypothetical protein
MGALSADLDVRSTLSGGFHPSFNVGGEYVVGGTVPIRGGYEVDTASNQQFFSVGLGIFSQGSGIDFAYRHQVQGGTSNLLVLSIQTVL